MSAEVVCLNESFKVVFYDGGSQDDQEQNYGIANALIHPRQPNPHCTKKGTNFDLLLEYTGPSGAFTLTHFVAAQPNMCTCPIKAGAVWVHESKPDLAQYKIFDNFDGKTKTTANGVRNPDAFFDMELKLGAGEIEDRIQYAPLEALVKLAPARAGKYVHIKFINCNEVDQGTPNIDVGYLGLVGIARAATPEESAAAAAVPTEKLEDMGLARRSLRKWNPLEMQFLPIIENHPAVLVVVSSEMQDQEKCKQITDAVKKIALSGEFEGRLNFFHTFDSPDDVATSFIYMVLQMPESKQPFVVITEKPIERTRYLLSADISAHSVQTFCQDYLANKLKPFKRSAANPPESKCPDMPEFFEVTYATFDDLVVKNTGRDFVLLTWNNRMHHSHRVKKLKYLHNTLAKLNLGQNLVFGRFDLGENDLPDHDWSSILTHDSVLLFKGADRTNSLPAVCDCETVEEFIQLLSKEISQPFEVSSSAMQYVKHVDAFLDVSQNAKQLVRTVNKLLDDKAGAASASTPSKTAIKPLVDQVATFINAGKPDELEGLEQAFAKLSIQSKPILEQAQRASSKRVVAIHSEAEFKDMVSQATAEKKLLVVDWTASWCGPCRFIAPHFATMSDLFHPECVFLKVDIDENSDLATQNGIQAVPTFSFYKDGAKFDTISGASVPGLFDKLNTHTNKNVAVSSLSGESQDWK